MTLIKKTTKTLVLGVALLGLAIGASSWASARTEAQLATGHLVNKGSGQFELRSSINPMDCQATEPTPCTYQILSPDNIPAQDSYTASELEAFETNGWIEPSNTNGVYQN
ncbi:hypothetical protein FAZ19_00065 [Sphingobacterium alkalisoli]|uniref:Uncharacterized protein n=1 Tax=Sphingobacterium alkalisoli TaxID=1874115 RepID=A0A4U0H7N5_9SPHI|nr:hypothetical protein [Sphingobacterium alkalisoli]TJY67696.1 hypothetical protein FAZ19_00065 [Sphingobacterium alkalisoli]GGH11922.1 hypothetical protein GCM10011418_11140 [Sphingobacterium alkalisoli]